MLFVSLLQELVGSAQSVQERAEGIAFLKVARSLHPLTTISYLGLNIPIGARHKGYVQCNYSDQSVKHCVSRERLPVHRFDGLGPALREPLDWSVLPPTPEAQMLLQHAGHLPAAQQVLSFPLRPLA